LARLSAKKIREENQLLANKKSQMMVQQPRLATAGPSSSA
jgi:hypothetical protein